MESPSTNEVENDACKVAHEVQVQPEVRDDENMVMESRVDFEQENSPQQRTDSLKEGNLFFDLHNCSLFLRFFAPLQLLVVSSSFPAPTATNCHELSM